MTDTELIERALRAGWTWHENTTEWPGSVNNPSTGWKTESSTSFITCQHPTDKVKVLRAKFDREPVLFGFEHSIDCRECGNPVWLNYLHAEELARKRECFSCNFWFKMITRGNNVVCVRDDGKPHHYTIGTAKNPSRYCGMGGHRWLVKFFDGRVVETCDLWHQGAVPERFLDRLPVNATLVNADPAIEV